MSQLLISILGIIAGIGAALVAAFATVWRERKKDILERYEERADIYKREHFKQLLDIIKNEGANIDKALEKRENSGLKYLETPRVCINFSKESELKVENKGWDYINDTNLESHLEHYACSENSNLKKFLKDIENKEKGYKEKLYTKLNRIMNELANIEDDDYNFKDGERRNILYKSGTTDIKGIPNVTYTNYYYKSMIINCMVDSIKFNEENFKIDHKDRTLKHKVKDYVILRFCSSGSDYGQLGEDFLKSLEKEFLKLCNKTADKYSKDICCLKEDAERIYKNYKEINKKFKSIVEDFEAGLPLKGSCNVCERIDTGKKNQKLMAYK